MCLQWPHNTGPIINYMASCGSNDCSSFDPSNAQWFKIDEAGKKSDGSGWVQAELSTYLPVLLTYIDRQVHGAHGSSDTGGTYSVNIPSDIAPGDYLIRHEVCLRPLPDL